jgi:hypothetical protein
MNRSFVRNVRSIAFLALIASAAYQSKIARACNNCGCCRVDPLGIPFEVGQPQAGGPAPAALPITPGSWTLAILPDTQHYSQTYPQHFTTQTQWIADNTNALNIKYVLHEGDIVNNNTITQWNNARSSLSVLDNAGVPYALAPGNHDYGPNGNSSTIPSTLAPARPMQLNRRSVDSLRLVKQIILTTRLTQEAKTGLCWLWNSARVIK